MIPRGEVGIVVAQIGLGMKAVGDTVYAVVLAMAVATTLIAPIFIKMAYAGEKRAPTPAEYEEELRGDLG
jgi:Kef-type K+ transport system membrane component KefB